MENNDERQPLLGRERPKTPLNKKQLAIVLLAKLADTVAYVQVYPYLGQMLEELLAQNGAAIANVIALVLHRYSRALCGVESQTGSVGNLPFSSDYLYMP
ncbi:hypothetical protein FRC00_010234 [Tulasnella sp. 408]|nr:hypothetical protein FRC00_010234 [Tulasnella sp. 408]